MKKLVFAVLLGIGVSGTAAVHAAEGMMQMGHSHDMSVIDTRTSLGLSGPMKQHQLANMRQHVEAIKTITGLLSEQKFAEAAGIAHAKLGLTPDMQAMCGMFENEDFKKLGLAFHKSGDDLGDVLKTGDMNASLRALNRTMQFCVQCHATYRQ